MQPVGIRQLHTVLYLQVFLTSKSAAASQSIKLSHVELVFNRKFLNTNLLYTHIHILYYNIYHNLARQANLLIALLALVSLLLATPRLCHTFLVSYDYQPLNQLYDM